jgi:hypothetical protein
VVLAAPAEAGFPAVARNNFPLSDVKSQLFMDMADFSVIFPDISAGWVGRYITVSVSYTVGY